MVLKKTKAKTMKKIKTALATLLLTAVSTAYAIELSLNQLNFSAGDPLTLTLTNEDWAGEADIYIALTLPADETLYFLTPSALVLDMLPFQQAQIAAGSREILQIPSLAPLSPGEYIFYAGVTVPDTLDIIGEIAMNTVIFVAGEFELGDISFPNGVVGRTYSFAIEPNSGMLPYQFSLISGTLPNGLTLNSENGLIQGTPSEKGSTEFTVQVTDARGDVADIEGVLNIFSVLTFGEHGTFKGCNGLQMAFNSAQDLDEIRVEVGTYECNRLKIPSNKSFENGLKISGGWDNSFEYQSDDAALTIFDGKKEGRILSVSADGAVAIEGLSFLNGKSRFDQGGAIFGNGEISVTNCVFSGNSTPDDGGAIYNVSNITNSTFSNNSASRNGGAVFDSGIITNSTFSNNSSNNGGAVYASHIINSTFSNNSAKDGGAVYVSSVINSTFSNNSASNNGGAVYNSDSVTNSTFFNNSSSRNGGAVYNSEYMTHVKITNSLFFNNSSATGGAIVNGTIINCTFVNNSALYRGGAFYGNGMIVNSIFYQNQNQVEVGEEANDIASGENLVIDYTLVNDIYGAVDLGTHFIMGEPRFVDADNGDFHLRSDSPAIDVGDDSVIELESDLDGNLRIVGGTIDLGAYEYQ